MASLMEKLRLGDQALDAERRSMNEALGRLRGAHSNINTGRPPTRLIIGLDLTGSRAARLPEARIAMASMLDVVRDVGRIMVKTIYYHGTKECCETQHWFEDMEALSRMLLQLSCETGVTQIARILERVLAEKDKPSAVVFIGDHCEEDAGELVALATRLGEKSVPVFVFHECADRDKGSLEARPLFKRMAEVSGGVYAEFKPDRGAALKEMLSTIAAFSAGGAAGINRLALVTTSAAQQLQRQLLLGPGKTGR